jgi:hypothetical protein
MMYLYLFFFWILWILTLMAGWYISCLRPTFSTKTAGATLFHVMKKNEVSTFLLLLFSFRVRIVDQLSTKQPQKHDYILEGSQVC